MYYLSLFYIVNMTTYKNEKAKRIKQNIHI